MSEEYKGAWGTFDLHCQYCGQHQVAVYPVIATEIECSYCHLMTPAPELTEEQAEFVERLSKDLSKHVVAPDSQDLDLVVSVTDLLVKYVSKLSKKHPLAGGPVLKWHEYEGYVRMSLTLDFALLEPGEA